MDRRPRTNAAIITNSLIGRKGVWIKFLAMERLCPIGQLENVEIQEWLSIVVFMITVEAKPSWGLGTAKLSS